MIRESVISLKEFLNIGVVQHGLESIIDNETQIQAICSQEQTNHNSRAHCSFATGDQIFAIQRAMLIDIDSSNACRHVEGNAADKIRRKRPVRKVEFRLAPKLYADKSPI